MTDQLLSRLAAYRVDANAELHDGVLIEVGIVDDWAETDSLLGPVLVAFNRRGVSFVRPATQVDVFAAEFAQRCQRPLRPGAVAAELAEGLRAGHTEALAVDLRGCGGFQAEVLAATREIPSGEVRSYGEVAAAIGKPKAVRAVGTALHYNPVPLVIPCHRVIRSDGSIGQYAFGSPAKARLLKAEGVALPG